MMVILGDGMKALQLKVAEKILKGNELKRAKEPRKSQVMLNMRPDFKLALMRAAKAQGRSMTYYLLEAAAKKMGWEDIF